MSYVLKAAQSAFERTLLYRRLYADMPQSLDEVRFISNTEYYRAAGTLDCIDREIEICSVLPPFQRGASRLPHTVLESDADVDARQERIQLALQDVGISEGRRVLIVTNESNGPFSCDLSTGLGWEGVPASIYYWNGRREDLAFQLEAHRPDYVIWSLPFMPQNILDFPVDQILVAHGIDDPLPEWAGPLWLFCDEFNLIGSRPSGRSSFRVDREQLYIEAGPAGRPYLTTLRREIFPLVRYELPNAFEVL